MLGKFRLCRAQIGRFAYVGLEVEQLPLPVRARSLTREFAAAHVLKVFGQVVHDVCGEQLAVKTQAKYLKRQVLWVAVENSATAQKLQLSLHIILGKLQEQFGAEEIKKIRIVQEQKEDY